MVFEGKLRIAHARDVKVWTQTSDEPGPVEVSKYIYWPDPPLPATGPVLDEAVPPEIVLQNGPPV